MNCCDDYGHCHRGRDCPARGTQRAPVYPFAPGVIEAPPKKRPRITRAGVFLLLAALLAGLASVLLGYLTAGWLA